MCAGVTTRHCHPGTHRGVAPFHSQEKIFMSRSNHFAAAALMALSVLVSAQAQTTAPAAAPAAAPAVAPAPAAATAAAAAPARDAASTADVSEGKVAHYGRKFAGRKTASGEPFNPNAMTMAHKSLPFGTKVRVTNLANKRSVIVRVNDRGPSTPDRVGDLSTAAARKIRATKAGVINAKLEVVGMSKMAKGGKKMRKAAKA
jgi:rare lipoprotein A